MEAQMKQNWATRLPLAARIGLLLVLSIVVIFMVGMLVGFSAAMAEHGHAPRKPLAYIFLTGAIAAGCGAVWAMVAIARSVRNDVISGFDKRYYRMWGILLALSAPIGIGLAIASDDSKQLAAGPLMLSNGAIDPTVAIAIAFIGTLLLAASAVIYHRTIDDHEERAYLWGSTIAFYFMAIAFPMAWLLARGGLIDALGIGTAMLILLVSFVIQGAVWLWFKFR